MARRNEITVMLNEKSIQNAITKLRTYQRTLDRKARQICEELQKVGLTECNAVVSSIPADADLGDISVEVESAKGSNGVYTARISLKGSQVAFVEFSAGVTFGSSSFPSIPGQSYGAGMGVGTFPGQTHAFDPEGWDYVDESGNRKHTMGNRAYMPMYHTDMAIRREVLNVARRVFAIR